ncbi:MAG: T9SS type A sorting domain-containing protein [Bacteroidetes bacterium]|nr:T9SS type A sorting domain-containing protein [Bacteroidota bacterium]
MAKKLIYLCLLLVLTTGAVVDIMSNGAPASSTGAPGEVSCTTSGCHDDNALNSGGGISSIIFGGGLTEYVPGTAYTISVNINQGTLNRFGFQLIALKDADNGNVGTFNLTEAGRTQIINGYGSLSGRKYITYTYPGTAAISSGAGQWSFEWNAPATDVGPVTLYLATIAANDDGSDKGDYCYLKSLQLTPAAVGINQLFIQQQFTVFPNPVNDQLKISYTLEKAMNVKLELYDIKGSKLQEWNNEIQAPGDYNQNLTLNSNYPKGVYLFKLIKENKTLVKKITINN